MDIRVIPFFLLALSGIYSTNLHIRQTRSPGLGPLADPDSFSTLGMRSGCPWAWGPLPSHLAASPAFPRTGLQEAAPPGPSLPDLLRKERLLPCSHGGPSSAQSPDTLRACAVACGPPKDARLNEEPRLRNHSFSRPPPRQ